MAEVKVVHPESTNLSYDPESRRITFDIVTIVSMSDESISAATCSVAVGRGIDIIQTLRDDIQSRLLQKDSIKFHRTS